MKHSYPLFFTLFLCLTVNFLSAQTRYSKFGFLEPTEDTIRLLIVYAQIDYTNCGGVDPYELVNGVNLEWPAADSTNCPNGLDCAPPIWADSLFDADFPTTGPTPESLTDYYFQASFGEYIVLGDHVSLNIPCDYVDDSDTNYVISVANGSRQTLVRSYMQSLNVPLLTARNKVVSDFDLWEYYSEGVEQSNVSTDNEIDALFIAWKNYVEAFDTGYCNGGFGMTGSSLELIFQNDTFNVHAASDWAACNKDAAYYLYTGEYLHALFGGNNWHSGGGAGPYTFMTYPHFYCTTAQYDNVANLFCAWDRNHLDWKGIRQFPISASDSSGNEVQADLTEPGSSGPFTETFLLRDMVMNGDAIRIKLPHINWQSDGDVKNQYLWLENHQLISHFDHTHFEGSLESTPWSKGMYAYLQVGKDILEGDSLQVFVESVGNSTFDLPNCLGSWLMPVTAEGNFDFIYHTELPTDCFGPNNIPIEKDLAQSNPFTGCSDLFNIYDENNNGILLSGDATIGLYRAEYVNDTPICAMQGYGDSDDAFRYDGKKKIGLGSNPAAVTILTLKSNLFYNSMNPPTGDTYTFATYENRIIHLNGLSVEIIDTIPNMTLPLCMDGHMPNDLEIQVRWDDYDIEDDVRWCADSIVLYPTVHSISLPLNNSSEYSLNITSGNSITLDRGKSPIQHVAYDQDVNSDWRFTQPTIMTCLENSYFHLEPNSDLYIRNGSTLRLESGSKLEVHDGATVHIEDGGTLIIEDGAELYVWSDGLVHIEEGARLNVFNTEADKGIILHDASYQEYNAQVLVEGQLRFFGGADFLYQGSGFYKFSGAPILGLSPGSDVIFNGVGETHKMLEISAKLEIDDHPVSLSNGAIEIDNESWMHVNNNYFEVDNVNFIGLGNDDNRAIYASNLLTCSIENSSFDGVATGIYLFDVTEPYSTISNCSFSECETPVYANNVSWLEVFDCFAFGGLSSTSIGMDLVDCKYGFLYNTTLLEFGINVRLENILGFYLDDNSHLLDGNSGIYGTDSKVFINNGSSIQWTQGNAIEMYGSWDDANDMFTSMLTMGSNGCAFIINGLDNIIVGENTLLNIDAIVHDDNGDDNDLYDHNWFYRESSSSGYLFDMCYFDTYPYDTDYDPIEKVLAESNIWCEPDGTNFEPSTSDYKFTNNNSCLPQSFPAISFIADPISECVPTVPDCVPCLNSAKLTDETDGEDTLEVTVENIVTNAFQNANEEFLIEDNDETREGFANLSALDIHNDTLNQQWSITTIAGITLPSNATTAHRIMVSKVLTQVNEDNEGNKMAVTGLQVEDIFEQYYDQLLPSNESEVYGLKVYPNPTESIFTVESNSAEVNLIVLSDLFGKQIAAYPFETRMEININDFATGMYLLKAISENGELVDVKKVVKE